MSSSQISMSLKKKTKAVWFDTTHNSLLGQLHTSQWIAHFRNLVCLCLKTSLRAKFSYENELDLNENSRAGETHLHKNNFARRLVLIQRQTRTRKWSIYSDCENRCGFPTAFCTFLCWFRSRIKDHICSFKTRYFNGIYQRPRITL